MVSLAHTEHPSDRYSLQAVVYHYGGSDSGHYVTRRVQPSNYGRQKWFEANDSKVTPVSCYTDELERKIVTPEAYILVYRRDEGVKEEALDSSLSRSRVRKFPD